MLNQDNDQVQKTADSNPQVHPPVSRRKFVTLLGAAGAALAAGGIYGVTPVEASVTDNCVAMTIAEMRALSTPSANYIYYVTDPGRQGIFYHDAADTTSADNTGTILVSTTGGKRYKRVVDGVVNVRWFGTVGDGIANDTSAIQAAISALNQGQTLLIPPGKYNITSITISGSYINITGGGTLYNGKLILGAVTYIVIDGMKFEYANANSGNIGIELQSAARVEIRNCQFTMMDKAIYAKPIANAAYHQVSRIKIHGNEINGVNYAVYGVRDTVLNPSREYILGDIHFENNQASCYISHIYTEGQDGFVCIGNTMFFPGFAEQSQTKVNNIYIKRANWVVIQSNNLFEAGEDAIVMAQFENANISNNNIAWPGQRIPGSGIRLKEGGRSANYCLSVVNGNNITIPTLHGISLEDNCAHINITGNQIRAAGVGSYYYGTTPLNTLNHYGISTVAASDYINISGNQASANIYNFLGNVRYADNIDSNRNYYTRVNDFSTPTLINGWANYGSGNATCQYYKDPQSKIHLKGVVSGGSVNTIIFTFPTFYRPSETLILTINTQNGFGKVSIDTSGNVKFINGDPTGYISLCGISFKV